MVNLNYPEELTEEEELLKKKYKLLRVLQIRLNASKQEPIIQNPVKRSLEVKQDAKEVAKKLLKSGAISAIKVETKEKQVFKRPKASERKRNYNKKINTTASEDHSEPMYSANKSVPLHSTNLVSSTHNRPVKKLYDSFVSSGKLEDEIKDNCVHEIQECKQGYNNWKDKRQASTVYVRGFGVTHEVLHNAFASVGSIVKVCMPEGRSYAFVTFAKPEEAEKAIEICNGNVFNGVRLTVLLAKQQR